MPLTRSDILEFLRVHKGEFHARYGVVKIGLAGSYARDEADEDSDIDIIVSIDSDNKFRSFFGLLHYLEDSFPCKIDMATESSLKARIKEKVMKDIQYA
jgi:hypothetical protein